MKRAAKIINKFGSPNCYLVSNEAYFAFSDLDTQQPTSRSKFYQLALVKPGIFPSLANWRN